MTVKMIQRSRHKWYIETEKGFVLAEDINLCNTYEAESYVKNYISSYPNWSYVIIPIARLR